MKTITISLQDDVYEQVQKEADTHKISIEQVIVNCLQRLTAQISGKEWPRSLDELFAARVRAQTQTGVGEFIEKKSTIERTLRKFIESLHLSRVITLSSLNV